MSRLRAGGRKLCAAAACAGAMLVMLPPTHSVAAKHGGALRVEIVGLPDHAAAKVSVAGPGRFRRSLRRSATLRGVPTGRYSVTVEPVEFERRFRGIPAGSVAYPLKRRLRVRVGGGRKAEAHARYGTIRSSRVVVLHSPPAAVVGDAANPRAIVPSPALARRLHPGTIVAARPGPGLPAGLFHQVVKLSRRHGKPLASLRRASLWDAFPTLDLDARIPLEVGSARAGMAQASGFDDVDLSFAKSLIKKALQVSCGGPPTGWLLSPSGSLHGWVDSDLHRRYLVLPYGRLTLTVKGKIGIQSTIPSGVHCGISVPGPALQGVVIVFGVPVPVVGKVDLNLDIQNDGPITANASATVTATAGIDFNGRKSAPILEVQRTATGAVTANGGSLTVGPEFQAGIGASEVNAHLSIEPQIAAKASRVSCEIDVGVVAGVGLDVLGFQPSYKPFSPSTPLYRCPLPDGIFFDSGPGTGPPPATLGPYSMKPFGRDGQDTGTVSGVSDPAGTLVFPDTLDHQLVGEGWATWSHGFDGDVYISDDSNTATVDLPAGTHAFYLYAEPNVFADFSVRATSSEGTSSGPITVYGNSGASFFGFYATGSKTLSRITVNAEDKVAIGEFGIAR